MAATVTVSALRRPVVAPETEMLAAARAEAVFASYLRCGDPLDKHSVTAAIRATVRRHHVAGCAALVAYEFGEHPETAVKRMRWARQVVGAVFGRRAA